MYVYFLLLTSAATFIPPGTNDYNLIFLPVAVLAVWSLSDPWPINLMMHELAERKMLCEIGEPDAPERRGAPLVARRLCFRPQVREPLAHVVQKEIGIRPDQLELLRVALGVQRPGAVLRSAVCCSICVLGPVRLDHGSLRAVLILTSCGARFSITSAFRRRPQPNSAKVTSPLPRRRGPCVNISAIAR